MRSAVVFLVVIGLAVQTPGCDCDDAASAPPGTDTVGCFCSCGADDEIDGTLTRQCGDGVTGLECGKTQFVCIPPDLVPEGETGDGGLRFFTDQQMFDLCESVCTTTVLAGAQEINGAFAGGERGCDLQCNQLPVDDESGPASLRGLVPDDGLLQQKVDLGCRETPDSETRLTCPSDACTLDGGDLVGAQAGLPGAIDNLKACTVVEGLANDPGCGNLSLPTAPVCLAPINDPPPITTPWVPMFVPIADGVLDASSTVRLFPAGGPEDGVVAHPSGRISVTGEACPGASCNVGVVVWLSVAPFEFDYSIADVPTGHLRFENTTISAQSNFKSIPLDSSGAGVLQPEDALGSVQANVAATILGVGSTQAAAFLLRPSDSVSVFVDWDAGTVSVNGAFSFAEDLERLPPTPAIDAVFSIHGALSARNPSIDAGDDRVVECAAGNDGTIVELSASASDPDGDLSAVSWFRGQLDALEPLGIGAALQVEQGLGAPTTYRAVAVDAVQKFASDEVSVVVIDTKPPAISDFANGGPTCLWSPRHDYVVFRVGHEIKALVEDACDPAPELEITTALSNQPDDASGDGNTINDVVVFPDRVCLRAERRGKDRNDRLYTVNVIARDASGNESDPTFQVRVAHDQRPDSDCPVLDNVLFVDDGDPLCDPDATTTATLVDPPATTTSAAGCGSTGTSGSQVVVLLLLVLGVRRRAPAAFASLPFAFTVACTEPPADPNGVRTCVVDVWLQPERVALSCPSTECAECAASDCKMRGFTWFSDEDSVVEGFIITAASLETFTSAGPPQESAWRLESDALVVGERSGTVRCEAASMVWDDKNLVRAPASAAKQFADAWAARDDDGSWRAKPLTLE